MTALLQKFSAAQAGTDRQLAVQTYGYVAAKSVIRVINCCFVVMARRKVVFPCVFCDKRCMSDTIECSACNSRAHPVCASMTHYEYQQFSADGMVRSGSMRSNVVRCCPMCSDVVPRSLMWPDVVRYGNYSYLLKSDGTAGQTTGHLEVDTPRATVPSLSACDDTRRDTGPWHCSSDGTDDESRLITCRYRLLVKWVIAIFTIFTGSIARSANLPVFSLLRGQF